MKTTTGCPGLVFLQAFLEDNDRYESVGLHLRECETCQELLNALSADVELESWRKAISKSKVFNAEPGCRQLLSRIIAGETISFLGEQTPSETPTLRVHLGASRVPGDLGTIDHYRIVKEVGLGGMSIVYEAIDSRLGRRVAIKVLRSGLEGSTALERFRREAMAIAAIRHSNVIDIHHVDTESTSVGAYLVMEFVPDGSLQSRISKKEPIDPRMIADWVAQVADGLQAAHTAGIIHRDIKPSNILMKRGEYDFNAWQPILADFGLAQFDNADSRLTQSGYLTGTPAYISPEQISEKIADASSDIYSLGITLFELLTGELPYRGNPHAVLRQIVNGDVPSPSKWNPSIPVDLETICLKATQFKARQRYVSAKAFGEDLRRWLRHEPIQARPTSLLERASRWCQRNSKVAALLGTVFGLLLLMAIGGIWSALSISRASKDLANQIETTTQASIEAKAASQRAIEQRQLALDSLNSLIDRVQTHLANKPGTLKLRADLLRTALDGLERVTKDSQDGQADHAAIEARIQMSKIHTILGNSEAAAKETLSALNLSEQALAESPDNLAVQEDYARALMLEASAKTAAFGSKDVQELYLKALGFFEPLRRKRPENLRVQHSWLECRQVLAGLSPPVASIQEFNDIQADIGLLLKRFPDDLPLKRAEYVVLVRLAGVLISAGRDGAREKLLEALPIAEELRQSDPDNPFFVSGQAQLHNKLSRLENSAGHFDISLEHANQSLKLFVAVASRDIENLPAQMLVGAAWDQILQVQLNRREYEQAAAAGNSSYENYKKLCEIDPKAVNYRMLAFESGAHIGDVYLLTGDQTQAIEWYGKAVELLDQSLILPNAPSSSLATYRHFYLTLIESIKTTVTDSTEVNHFVELTSKSGCAEIYGDAVRLYIEVIQNRQNDAINKANLIRNSLNTAKEPHSRELDQLYRSQAFVLTARSMVVLHRQRGSQDECLPLAIRLLSQLVREQPNSAAILADIDFREIRDAIATTASE